MYHLPFFSYKYYATNSIDYYNKLISSKEL